MNSPGPSTNLKCMWFEVTNDRMLLQGLVRAGSTDLAAASTASVALWLLPKPSTSQSHSPSPTAEALSLAGL